MQCGHPGHAERDVRRPLPPGATERVADDHAHSDTGELGQPLVERQGGGVRVERQQDDRTGPFCVGGVDAGRRTHEAMACPRDDERGAGAHDLRGLLQDHLHLARIALGACELDRAWGRLDLVEQHDPALDLRHRLLGDDDDVTLHEPAGTIARLGEEQPQIVALLQLGDAREADDADLGRRLSIVPIHHRSRAALSGLR